MPSDLWEIVETDDKELQLRFRRPMVETDFARWQYYAPRIRCLGFVPHKVENSSTYIDPEVINVIRLEPALRLPNLRQISWGSWNDDMFINISPFIGVTVTHFSIIGDDDYIDDLPPVLLSLSLHCPHIQQVDIPRCLSVDLSTVVSRWHSLTYLKCVQSSFTIDGIAHLACLPNLNRLDFLLPGGLDYKALSGISIRASFPALEKLSIATAHLTSMINFLDVVHSCCLRKITIYFDETQPLTALQRVLGKLGAIRPHAVLDHLGISDARRSQVGTCVITPDDLGPLFSFKNLRHLSIDLHVVVALDNAWLKAAVSTWPRLHHLQIEDCVQSGLGPKVTSAGLPVLADLRELQFLMVRIDTGAMDWSSNLGVCSTTVKTLRLDGSNIEDPLEDFCHLLGMFPRVNCVGVRGVEQEVRIYIEMILRENKRQRLASSSFSRAIGVTNQGSKE